MRVRTVGLFAVAAALLIALLLVIRGAITTSPAEPAASGETAPRASDDSTAAPAASARPGSPPRRDPTIRLPVPPPRNAPATPDRSEDAPELAPSEPAYDGIAPRVAANSILRLKTLEVRPLVEECVNDVRTRGMRLTGTVTLSHIVARGPNRTVVVETSDVDHDQTTIDYQPLLECLQKTTSGMKFEYVENGVPVVALRKVVLENGALVDYQHLSSKKMRQ